MAGWRMEDGGAHGPHCSLELLIINPPYTVVHTCCSGSVKILHAKIYCGEKTMPCTAKSFDYYSQGPSFVSIRQSNWRDT